MLLHHLVGDGDARLTILEFEHGMDEVGLYPLAFLIRVLEHMPRVGAVPPPLEADILHHREEGQVVLGVDPIFGDREDWAPIVSHPIEEARGAPEHRWSQILRFAGLQLPRPREREADQRTDAGRPQRDRHALSGRDFTPHRAAERQRAEVDSEENRQTPTAHPLRQSDLRRDKKGRQRDDRRGAGDEAGDERQNGLTRCGEQNERDRGSERAKRRLPVRA